MISGFLSFRFPLSRSKFQPVFDSSTPDASAGDCKSPSIVLNLVALLSESRIRADRLLHI